MYVPERALFLLAIGHVLPLASAFFLSDLYSLYPTHQSPTVTGYSQYSQYSHCTHYSAYNTLVNLMNHDECMNIDSVFKLLADMTTTEHTGLCRIHVIHLLAGYFGSNAKTPAPCTCRGTNELHPYPGGHGVGVPNLKDHCLSHDSHYKDLFNQFFENSAPHHHHEHDKIQAPACRTHHSVWAALDQIDITNHDASSCQKDIIFHLQYYFEKHADSCSCTGHIISSHTNGHTGSENHHCLSYNSYNALLKLGNTNGCLSANSVWHYLDDLQVKDPVCRQQIQKHLADKYHAGSHIADDCTCSARKPLVNHEIHRMANGSYTECEHKTSGTYKTIESELFSNIRHHGCRNHDYLWTQLEGINNFCSQHYHTECRRWTDCTQDLIVRAATQYPTDVSDSCVCVRKPTPTTTRRTTAAPTTTTSTTAAPQTTAAPTTTTSTTAAPQTTAAPPATTAPTTAKIIQPTSPPKKFSCNELAAVEQIAQAEQARHPDASPCSSTAGGSDDAYVLSSCNMTSPMTWRKGPNVMADCESNAHLISGFTPISTFSSQSYSSLGAQAGIFLECYNTGFKMAIQKCDGVPEIVHIENGGVFTHDPRNYYVIV